ncbi:hypothetical protein BHM03_00041607, partial [Ensete ventricosum]
MSGGSSRNCDRYCPKEVDNGRFQPLLPNTKRYQPSCDKAEGEASKKERVLEEEGELGEHRRELISTPFLDLNMALPSLDDPDPGGNSEESHKEEDLEASETPVAIDVFAAFFAECRRRGDKEKRRRRRFQ